MTKTILITGTSSGYGKATAEYFLARGWNVIATMRRPDAARFAGANERLRLLPLDVTSTESIDALIDMAGPIDVLVNNAGIGIVGAFEATPMAAIRQIFDANTFGVMAMTQAVIPQMRRRRAGCIVNVTSSATLMPMPLAAAYTASKQAIEGFSGSLALEMRHFGIAVKTVQPGYAPTTSFADNAIVPFDRLLPSSYADFAGPILEGFAQPALTTKESDVAEVIWGVAQDSSERLAYPAGADAVAIAEAR